MTGEQIEDPSGAAAPTGDATAPDQNTALLLQKLEEKTLKEQELTRRLEQMEQHGGSRPQDNADARRLMEMDDDALKQCARSDEPLAPFARRLLMLSAQSAEVILTTRERTMIENLVDDAGERKEFSRWFAERRDHFSGPDAGYDAFIGSRERAKNSKTSRQREQDDVNAATPRTPTGGAPQEPAGLKPRSDGKRVMALSDYIKNQTAALVEQKDKGEIILDYNR